MMRGYLDRMLRPRPLDGYVIAPTAPRADHVAQIICGHPVVQAQSEARQAEFETFVCEVLLTEAR